MDTAEPAISNSLISKLKKPIPHGSDMDSLKPFVWMGELPVDQHCIVFTFYTSLATV